jgi:hypothetical protein
MLPSPLAPQTPVAAIAASISLGTPGDTASVSDRLYVRSDDVFNLWGAQKNPSEVFVNDTLVYTWVLAAGSAGTEAEC